MKVLVTGADGFIGSHLTQMLVERNFTVRATVMYSPHGSQGWLHELPSDILKEVEVVPTDIRDADAMRKTVVGCEAILNLAALIGIPYSYVAPQSYFDTNVQGTLNLLLAARDLGVRQFIQTSTSEVYGTAQQVPIREDHPLQAQSPYAASKIAADQLALSFYRSFELPVKVIRPFNTYGPRQSARAVIPTIISQLRSNKDEITLGSLHPTRDFTYVSDTAAGFIAVLDSAMATGQVVNLGGGFEISIGQLAQLIAAEMGLSPRIMTANERKRPSKSEVERLWADTTLAQSLLTWSPSLVGIEGLQIGLNRTIHWFAKQAFGNYRAGEFQQ